MSFLFNRLLIVAPWYLYALAALGLTYLGWNIYADSRANAEVFATALTQAPPKAVDLATVAPGTQGNLAHPLTGEIALTALIGDGYWKVRQPRKGIDDRGIAAEIYADDAGFAAKEPRGVLLFNTEEKYEAFMQASVQGESEAGHLRVTFWSLYDGYEPLREVAISAVESEGMKLPSDRLMLRPELEERATVLGKRASPAGDLYIGVLAAAIAAAVVARIKFLRARKKAAHPVI